MNNDITHEISISRDDLFAMVIDNYSDDEFIIFIVDYANQTRRRAGFIDDLLEELTAMQ